jgi:hypothetical protein
VGGYRSDDGEAFALGSDRVIAAMGVALAPRALFFDVRHFSGAAYVTVSAHHASAGKRRET